MACVGSTASRPSMHPVAAKKKEEKKEEKFFKRNDTHKRLSVFTDLWSTIQMFLKSSANLNRLPMKIGVANGNEDD